ncbi:hypothetical protein HBE96_04770 [Clostridium sp. P21]|uniref:Uncharacterized protein n=1 Tax=Clostridium muellerianum TaxID=2716538 RepID=A0A7Y0HNU5_9CLOT|nr:hypothetical protein [Clostridium muellerianum]NMM62013.1 hypothetical protein [Clostridium muellerianum]
MNINTTNDIYQYLVNPLYNNSLTTDSINTNSDDSTTDITTDSIQLSKTALSTLNSTTSSIKYGQPYTNNANNFVASNINLTDSIKSKLSDLVTAGTITQDQEDQIENFIQQKNEDREAEMNALKTMSASDRKAYFEQKKSEGKPDLLKDLVSSNIITQDQASSIGTLTPTPPNKLSNMYKNNLNTTVKSTLDNLVSSKVITQDQEDTIINSIDQNINKSNTETNLSQNQES